MMSAAWYVSLSALMEPLAQFPSKGQRRHDKIPNSPSDVESD
jgi:hypothetical protein